jgi:L-rhamnose mutarotase
MMRAAYLMQVRPGKAEGYRESHRAVWPELIAAANRAGIRNHSVFLKDGLLFLYLEADDLERSMAELLRTDVKRRWDEYMEKFLEPGSARLEEVFYMP